MYLKSTNCEGETYVSFLHGASKLAPRSAVSIPRLELCAALDAALNAQQIIRKLAPKPESVFKYSDSKVVIGYINNETKRFTKYVARRIEIILNTFKANLWHYVKTSENPADIASRPHNPVTLSRTVWLRGPAFLKTTDYDVGPETKETGELPEQLGESSIRSLTSICNK